MRTLHIEGHLTGKLWQGHRGYLYFHHDRTDAKGSLCDTLREVLQTKGSDFQHALFEPSTVLTLTIRKPWRTRTYSVPLTRFAPPELFDEVD